jgi:hypothetical protein
MKTGIKATATQITGSELWQVETNQAVIFQGSKEEAESLAGAINQTKTEEIMTEPQVNRFLKENPHALIIFNGENRGHAANFMAEPDERHPNDWYQITTENYPEATIHINGPYGGEATPADKGIRAAEQENYNNGWKDAISQIADGFYLEHNRQEAQEHLKVLQAAALRNDDIAGSALAEAADRLNNHLTSHWGEEIEKEEQEKKDREASNKLKAMIGDQQEEAAYQNTIATLRMIDPAADEITQQAAETAANAIEQAEADQTGEENHFYGVLRAATEHVNETRGLVIEFYTSEESNRYQITNASDDLEEARLWKSVINNTTTIRARINE